MTSQITATVLAMTSQIPVIARNVSDAAIHESGLLDCRASLAMTSQITATVLAMTSQIPVTVLAMTSQIPVIARNVSDVAIHESGLLDCRASLAMTSQIPVTVLAMTSQITVTVLAMTSLFRDGQSTQTKVLRLGGPGAGVELAGARALPLPGAGHTPGIDVDEIEGTASGIDRLFDGFGAGSRQRGQVNRQALKWFGLQGQMAVLAHDLAGQGVKFACL